MTETAEAVPIFFTVDAVEGEFNLAILNLVLNNIAFFENAVSFNQKLKI